MKTIWYLFSLGMKTIGEDRPQTQADSVYSWPLSHIIYCGMIFLYISRL